MKQINRRKEKTGERFRQFAESRTVRVLQLCGLAGLLAACVSMNFTQDGNLREEPAQAESQTLPEEPARAAGRQLPEEKEQAADRILVFEDETKQVALTFDDGPHRVYTKMLLDGLAKRKVRATFFVIGKNIPGNEELIARMQQEGHLIGNHTYDHVKISDLSGEEACEQVEKTSALVREITGEDTEFVRPPFGAWNKSMEGAFTMIPVMWDVDPLDWTTKNRELIEQRVLEDVSSGDIILLHDYYESSVEAALELVDQLLAQGYEFVTVDELILE